MKSCLVEMKKAIESDMERRDEAIQQNYVTEDTIWYELHNQAATIYQAFQDMVGLHEAALGKKQPSDDCIKHWENLVGNNELFANLLNQLSRNRRKSNNSTDLTENC